MSENKDYWKELLGDEFDEELYSSVISPDSADSDTGEIPVEEPQRNDTVPEAEDDTEDLPSDFDFAEDNTRSISMSSREKNAGVDSYGGIDKGPDSFKVDFDFDREYGNPDEARPVKRNKERRSGCLGGILYFVFILCVSIALASLGWLAATDVLGLGDKDQVVEVTVPDNFTMKQVTDLLYSDGLIKYKSLFKLYASFSSAADKIDAGTYQLNTNYDYRALVYGMSQGSGKLVEIDVTIPEGYTLKQIIDLLVTNKVCSEDELWEAAKNYDFDYDFLDDTTLGQERRLEGYLFPDTYTFYVDDSPTRVLSKMLYNFDDKWTEEFDAQTASMGLTTKQILTIASIIEKEAGSESERADISSVIYNRLDYSSDQLLELDSTVNYIISYTDQPFSTDIDSPYNTYKYPGLPVGPICNPGLASIEAALNPNDTDYFYFALGIDGATRFFSSYDEFISFTSSDQYGG